MQFRWIEWNIANATKHGCTIGEIESIVEAGRHSPRHIGDEKLMIVGRGQGGRWVEVIYLVDEDGTIFVIHAMPLTTRRRRG